MPTSSARKATSIVSPARRSSRTDGTATRQHLLEVAGQVFAQSGFVGATSKEICERAGTPLASVNYHFGSREALYEAVLIEAHRHLIGLDEMLATTAGLVNPRDKLHAIISHVGRLSTRPDTPWGFRVMLREVLSPSASLPALIDKGIRPKAAFMIGLVAEVMALPSDHAAVQRGVLFTILPCIAMMIAPKEIPAKLLPAAVRDASTFVDDFVTHSIAGLDALAETYRVKRPHKC